MNRRVARTSDIDPKTVARAQWLRAAVLGANDGLVSVAFLMIGVGAINDGAREMLVSGLAGLVAGACSMAIDEFMSVYAQYDIKVARTRSAAAATTATAAKASTRGRACRTQRRPWPRRRWRSRWAPRCRCCWAARVAAVCAASSLGLVRFGAAGACLGGANVVRSGLRAPRAPGRVAGHGGHVRDPQALQLGVQDARRVVRINHVSTV